MKKKDLILVTDMQNVYKKGGKWECPTVDMATENILKILKEKENFFIQNKEKEIPFTKKNIIFTRFIANKKAKGVWAAYNKKYKDVNSDPFANAMMDSFKDWLKKYPLYTKGVYSSLKIPQVLKACKKSARTVITGVISECCVLSTVFDLIDHGIYVIYLTDATSGLDKEKEEGTLLMLQGLCPLHLKIMTTKDYLEENQ